MGPEGEEREGVGCCPVLLSLLSGPFWATVFILSFSRLCVLWWKNEYSTTPRPGKVTESNVCQGSDSRLLGGEYQMVWLESGDHSEPWPGDQGHEGAMPLEAHNLTQGVLGPGQTPKEFTASYEV